MARIRTIKPDFFRHEGLFELEREAGLPVRLAFAGLWTAADKAGRFRWQPRTLKLDCLPYDDVDFSRVLDALATRGFLVAYTVKGEKFGHIPGWSRHQAVNNREQESKLPSPEEGEVIQILDARSTRDNRENDASATPLMHTSGEGKGKEGEGNKNPSSSLRSEEGVSKIDASATRASRDPKTDLYRRGDEVLGKNSGGVITKLLQAKDGSVPQARAAIEQAAEKHNPSAYIGAIIRNKDPPRDEYRDGRI